MSTHRAWLVLALSVLVPAGVPLNAQEDISITRWSALTIDNDFFHGSDEQYTNGARFTRIRSRDGRLEDHGWKQRWANRLMATTDGKLEDGWYLAQYIFTPSDRRKLDLGPTDRPYAGWIGGGVWLRETSDSQSRALALTLGWVGPGSLAERVQDGIHEIIDHTEYTWSEELRNEPTLNLHFRESRRLWEHGIGDLRIRLDAEGGVDVGNIFTGAVGRAIIRFGSFAPAPYFPTERFGPGPQIGLLSNPRDSGWGFLLGAEARVVGRDIFLDGNTFKDSHSVDSKPLIGSFMTGVSLKLKSWVFHYTFVYHGRVYKGQEDPHRYGSIVIARQF